MPVLPPKPPLGGMRCAASPTTNTRLRRIGFRIADGVHHHETRLAILLQAKEPAEHRIVDVDDADRLVAELPPQVGAKIDRHAVREDAAAVERDAEDVAHSAVCA